MTAEHARIVSEYTEYLKRTGKTYKNHRSAMKRYFEYIERDDLDYTRISILDAQNYQEYLSTRTMEKGGSYATVSVISAIGRLTSFYTYAHARGIVAHNPFQEIIRLRREKSLPRNILDEEKMGRLLFHLRNFVKGTDLIERKQLYRAHVIAELMYSTGARINEVASLRAEDIDFTRSMVRLKDAKTGKERMGILNSYAHSVLRIYTDTMRKHVLFLKNGADERLLFGSGGSIRVWFNEVVNRESEKIKLGRFSSHNIRHAMGAHLLKNGCDIRWIQEFLGHVRLGTTQIYTKVVKEDLRAVIDRYHPRTFRRVRDEIF
jgi:site-specific recombinase XerD